MSSFRSTALVLLVFVALSANGQHQQGSGRPTSDVPSLATLNAVMSLGTPAILLAQTSGNQSGPTAQPPFQVSRQPPKLEPRKPCQLIEDWIEAGGTRANFSGIGVSGFAKPFPLCFPVRATISHTAHDRFANRCHQTYQEINLAYDMEHEGELWLSQDLSQAYAEHPSIRRAAAQLPIAPR